MRLNIIEPSSLELIGVLTKYESVQWESTFNTPDGSFQINCSTDYAGLLQVDKYVENTEDSEHVGVIKRVETITSNQKTSLQVKGVMLEKDIFYRRVIKAFIVYQDMYPTDVLANIIALSLTNPPEPTRVVSNIGQVIIPKEEDVPDMTEIQYTSNYANLGDEVFSLIQNLNLGVKSRINHETNKIDIEFYVGVDRTFGSDNSIVFSPERGNVIETDYVKDSSQNFNTLIALGQDKVILQSERERNNDEPIVEKSIDLSNECPWPTYRVERPDEEGGQYYRYKKYDPPEDFITNRDVWEKYAVERKETTETYYRRVESTETGTTTVGEIMSNPEMFSNVKVTSLDGVVKGSAVSTSAAVSNAVKNLKPGTEKKVGTVKKSSSNAAKSVSLKSAYALKSSSSKPTSNANNSSKAVSSTSSKVGVSTKVGLSVASSVAELSDVMAKMDDSGKVTFETKSVSYEPYNVTIVTYETKDFLEYVYVNAGDEPTEATKIIKGSFASGDVTIYENFVDIKVEEVEYRNTLKKKSEELLKTFVLSEAVTIKPYSLSNLRFGSDFSLGDIVTTRNAKLGYSVDVRITKSIKIWDSKGYNVDLTLGDSIPTLTNRIKLIAKGGA